MKCKLLSYAISTEPFGIGKGVTKCETHNWMMDYPVSGEALCPIGQIEEARDQALASIAAAVAAASE